jgi:O-antigen/teichoic acid export membrane protein
VIGKFRSWVGENSFLRQAVVLTVGTLLGRAIAVLAMPVLTRIYSPDDFSVLASYSAILGMLAVIACLRLEIAIPMPEDEDIALDLLTLSLICTIAVALITVVVLLLAFDPILSALSAVDTALVLWLVPLGGLLVGSYQAFQFWATRQKLFTDIARTRVGQAAAGVVAMLGLGAMSVGPVGLSLGHMLMSGAGALGLAWRALRDSPDLLRRVSLTRARRTLLAYRRFPIWSMPEALANVAGLQIPILIIASAAPPGEAGHLMVAMQVMLLPMALVGNSIGQVYLSRAPEEHRNGRLGPFTLSIVRRLALVGALPIAIVGLSAPWTFPLVFGADWTRSGEIAAMMVPWIILQFVVVPVSMSFHVVGHTMRAMQLQVAGFILRFGGVLFATQLHAPLVPSMVTANAVFYAGMLALIPFTVRDSEHSPKDLS